jgi:hypothetical protein
MYINSYKENDNILNSAHNKYNFALTSSRTVWLEFLEGTTGKAESAAGLPVMVQSFLLFCPLRTYLSFISMSWVSSSF